MFQQVKKDNHLGIINSNEKLIIPIEYSEFFFEKNSTLFYCKKKNSYDCYDPEGKLIKEINFKFISFDYFNDENFFMVTNDLDDNNFFYTNDNGINEIIGKIGMINNKLQLIVPNIYEVIWPIKKHIILYKGENIKFDHSVEPKEWKMYDDFYRLTGGKWGVSDYNHTQIIPFEYDFIQPTSVDDIFLVNKGGVLVYYKGNQIRIGSYNIHKGGKWGLINSKNEILVGLIFDQYTYYDGGTNNRKITFEGKEDGTEFSKIFVL